MEVVDQEAAKTKRTAVNEYQDAVATDDMRTKDGAGTGIVVEIKSVRLWIDVSGRSD